MITEKQVREALDIGMCTGNDAFRDLCVNQLKKAGLIAPEPEKPLLMDAVAPMVVVHGEAMFLLSGSRLSAHQAALDEFAKEVEKHQNIRAWSFNADGAMVETQPLKDVLAKARAAGLTRVGA